MKIFQVIVISLLLSFFLNGNRLVAQNIDIQLLQSIHSDSSIIKDRTYNLLSKSVTPIALVSSASILLTGYLKQDKQLQREGLKAVLSLTLNTALTAGLKYTVNRKRPFVSYPEKLHAKNHVGPYSFPSGHTSVAFSTATSLTLATKKWYIAIPAFAWASGVAMSRMYLGVHYPSDILGGIVIGIGTAMLTWKIDQWMIQHNKFNNH